MDRELLAAQAEKAQAASEEAVQPLTVDAFREKAKPADRMG
jgi:hypothetical protein